jgi:hypothetical protein
MGGEKGAERAVDLRTCDVGLSLLWEFDSVMWCSVRAKSSRCIHSFICSLVVSPV